MLSAAGDPASLTNVGIPIRRVMCGDRRDIDTLVLLRGRSVGRILVNCRCSDYALLWRRTDH